MKIIKEKIVACVFLLLNVFIASQVLNAQGPFGGGLGIPGNPYLIYDKGHLEELADSLRSATFSSKYYYYKLTNDITDSVRTTIGGSYVEEVVMNPGWPPTQIRKIASFQGSFDGDGYHIVLAIKIPTNPTNADSVMYSSIGMFGDVVGNTIIKNIIVSGYVEGYSFAGGIIGIINSAENLQVSNCINMATITGRTVGGIIGRLVGTGIIENCSNIGDVTSDNNSSTGGIIGSLGTSLTNTIIKNCTNNNFIKSGDVGSTGGIIGYSNPNNPTFDITNCINTGVLEGGGPGPYGGGGTGPIWGNAP